MCGLLCGLVCGQPRHPTVCSSALYAMRASAAARRLSRDVHMYLPVRSRDILSTPVELPNDLPRSPAAGSHSTPTSGASPSPSPDSSAPSTPQSHAISHEISLYVYTTRSIYRHPVSRPTFRRYKDNFRRGCTHLVCPHVAGAPPPFAAFHGRPRPSTPRFPRNRLQARSASGPSSDFP